MTVRRLYHQLLAILQLPFFSILYSLIVLPISRFCLATFTSFDLLLFCSFGCSSTIYLCFTTFAFQLFNLLVFLISSNCSLF
ncbi:unnamed protein product [Meloidogyne enterolobii]|uniref:Uncharacterized protein n=1 Tax=Meloidogyne enterolobii TaxID=390850 RepID=A0ACB1A1G9_MELEN